MNKYAAFPLDLVLLPNEQEALHLFEERYLQLYEDHKNGKPFVIVYRNSEEGYTFGSLVKIEQTAEQYPDGTIDIIIKGIAAFQIDQYSNENINGKLYPIVLGDEINVSGTINSKLKDAFSNCLNKMNKNIAANRKIDLFYIAHRIGLDNLHKKELMLIKNNAEMNSYLYNQIKLIKCCIEQEEKLKRKFHLN